MTVEELKKLKMHDRVRFAGDGVCGIVAEKSYAGVQINWDDGQAALLPFQNPQALRVIAQISKVE